MDTPSQIPLMIGCYTPNGESGLYTATLDTLDMNIQLLDSLPISNASYLALSPSKHDAYVVSENKDTAAKVYTINYTFPSGKMQILNEQSTHGDDPCYIATNGRLAVLANYDGGNMVVYPVEDNGALGTMQVDFKGSIGGKNLLRQQTPHVHCAQFSPDQQWIFFTDFSADRLIGVGQGANRDTIQLESGSGPRHLIFSKNGKHAYVISELSGKITAFDYDGYGKLTPFQTIVADEAHGEGSADIQLSPDGKFLYASHRLKNDGISIFSVSASGMLTKIGYQHTGKHPRQFSISPDGKYLLCTCKDAHSIQIYKRDMKTGLLQQVGQDLSFRNPVCVKFCPQ